MAHPQLNVTILDFHGTEAGNKIIDCARALSLYNRRSYRSGFVYSVDYIEYIGSAGDAVTVACLPQTYTLLNAYRLGYDNWRQQRADTIEESGLEPGKWSDFKPWYSEEHLDGSWAELSPRGMGTGLGLQQLDQTGAEWNRAELVVNDFGAATTTTYNVGMLGANAVPYGSLMEAHGDTRAATLSPDPLTPAGASGSWITRTGEQSGELSEKIVTLIEDENDEPPYANQADTALPPTYVGNDQSAPRGVMLDLAVTGATGRPVSLNGGLIPLGLLALQIASTGPEYVIRVHMTRGTYKGVAAKSMGSFR